MEEWRGDSRGGGGEDVAIEEDENKVSKRRERRSLRMLYTEDVVEVTMLRGMLMLAWWASSGGAGRDLGVTSCGAQQKKSRLTAPNGRR